MTMNSRKWKYWIKGHEYFKSSCYVSLFYLEMQPSISPSPVRECVLSPTFHYANINLLENGTSLPICAVDAGCMTVLWPPARLSQWATLKSHSPPLPWGWSPWVLWEHIPLNMVWRLEIFCLFFGLAGTRDYHQETAASCLLNDMVSAPAGRHPAATEGEGDSSLPLHSPGMWGLLGIFN